MCLCLSAHSTHLLQLLDVGVFNHLKQNYKTLLAKKKDLQRTTLTRLILFL